MIQDCIEVVKTFPDRTPSLCGRAMVRTTLFRLSEARPIHDEWHVCSSSVCAFGRSSPDQVIRVKTDVSQPVAWWDLFLNRLPEAQGSLVPGQTPETAEEHGVFINYDRSIQWTMFTVMMSRFHWEYGRFVPLTAYQDTAPSMMMERMTNLLMDVRSQVGYRVNTNHFPVMLDSSIKFPLEPLNHNEWSRRVPDWRLSIEASWARKGKTA